MNTYEYLRWVRWAILAGLLISPVPSLAAKWVLLSVGDDYEVEIESESVRPNKGAWFRYTLTPPSNEFCTFQSKKISHTQSYVEVNCKDFTIRTKQRVSYDEGGSVIGLCSADTPDAHFQEYAPETVGETYFKAICNPEARAENSFLNFLRNKKRDRLQKEAEHKLEEERRKVQKEGEERTKALLEKYRREANTPGALEAARKRAAELDAREHSKKQAGEACASSSECAGTLVCAAVDGPQMRCVPSELVIRGLK